MDSGKQAIMCTTQSHGKTLYIKPRFHLLNKDSTIVTDSISIKGDLPQNGNDVKCNQISGEGRKGMYGALNTKQI